MAIKKHVGRIKSSDQRCVVVFMQLPDNKEKALIINSEALPPRFEQLLQEVVDSAEGQRERDLANAMARRTVPETGRTVLEEFHRRGLLRAESIDNVVMMPRSNTPFPLRDILKQMGEIDSVQGAAKAPEVNSKHNQVTANMTADKAEERLHLGNNLLMEARMLEAEAQKKREQAYRHAPSLRPSVEAPVAVVVAESSQASAKADADAAEAALKAVSLDPKVLAELPPDMPAEAIIPETPEEIAARGGVVNSTKTND